MANQIKYKVGFDVDNKSLKSLQNELIQLQKMTSKDFMKINPGTSLSKAEKELQQIKKTAKQVDDALDKAFSPRLNSLNLGEFKKQLNGLSIDKIYNDFSKMGATGQAAFRSLSNQMLTVNTRIRESHSLLDKMATTLSNTLKWNVASSAINGMSHSIDQAWGYVKSLDGSLNDIRIVTGKSSDEMARFAVQANNAAKQLGKTTTDYTKASLIYAQQGLSDEEIAARAAITLKAANVTGQSTDAVSEELTAVWNGYKVTAEEAEVYVDRLAAVAAHTASNLEELSTGMSKVASAAAAMGVGEDQLAAQLSTIISVTRQAPESVGTALRTVYARISDIKAGIDEDGVTLGNYSGKMAELGFNVLDAAGNLRDMGEVMEEIGNKWQFLTREQQVNLAQTMAGQRQYSNLIALFDNFSEYNRALNIAQNAAGTLQQQQDTYMESTVAHFNQLKASVEDVYDSFMNRDSLDSVNDLIDALSDGATIIARFVDSLGGGMNILSSLGALGVTVFSKQIAGSIQTTINNFKQGQAQAEAFKIAVENAQTLQDKGYGNEATQQLIKKGSQIANMGQVLPTQQFENLQQGLNDITALTNQIEILDAKEKELLDTYQRLSPALQDILDNYGKQAENALQSEDGIADLKNRLEDLQKAYAPVVEQQRLLNEEIRNMQQPGKSFSGLMSWTKGAKTDLLEYIKTIKTGTYTEQGDLLFDTFSERNRQTVDWIENALNQMTIQVGEKGLDKETLQIYTNQIEAYFEDIKHIVQAGRKDVSEALQGAKSEALEKLRAARAKAEQDRDKKTQNQNKNLDNAISTATIKSYVDFAGGLAQVGASIQQIQNLGSIWQNKDLNVGQKFLQIITNLGMSLPMLVTGFQKMNSILKIYNATTAATQIQSVKAGISLGGQALSFKLVETSAGKAALSVKLFNKQLLFSGVGAAIVGLTALAAVLAIVIGAWQEYNKKKIEADKATIDEQNKKQQQIQKNRQLSDSIEELNNQYKNSEITRAELKSGVQDLINEYGLEGQQVEKLTRNYDNLDAALQNFRKTQAEEALASSIHEKDAAKDAMLRQARQDNGFGTIGEKYTVNFANDIPSELIDKLDFLGSTSATGFSTTLTIDYDEQHLLKLYDTLVEIRKEMQLMGLEDSKGYDQINDWIKKQQESVEQYRAAIDDINNNATFIQANTQDFSNIENFNQYREQRQKLIDALSQNQNIQSKDLNQLADTYLSQYFQDLYNQFDQGIEQIEQYEEKFGKIPTDIDNLIKGLNKQNFNKFLELNPDILNNWEQLRQILKNINQLNNKTATTIGDIQARNKENLDNFKKYDEVKEKVSQGKEIKDQDYGVLPQQLQQFFTYAGDGMYKLAENAKGFYDAIDNLKLQGFRDTIQAIQGEIQNLQQVAKGDSQGNKFNYKELSQNAYQGYGGIGVGDVINQDLAQKQLQYLNAATTKGSQLNMIVQSLLEKESLSKSDIEQINELISQVGDKTKDINGNLEGLNGNLKQQYQQLYDAMFPTDEDVDTKKLQALSDQLQELATQSDALADSLQSDGRTAEDVAQALLRFSDATKDVADNYDDWMKALNSGSLGDQAEAIAGLRDAYADLLDFPEDAFSDQFLTSADNLNLLKEAANGSTEAYDQLMQAAQQDIATQVGLDTSAFDAAFDSLMNKYYQGQSLEDMQIGASLNDEGFLQGLTDMVNAAGMTAEQATAYLASMGVDAQVIEQDTEAEEVTEAAGYTAHFSQKTAPFSAPIATGATFAAQTGLQYVAQDLSYEPNPTSSITKKQNKAFSLKVTSAHKSSGGGFKYSNAPGKKSYSGGKGSGGGGGKGGGGGSGSQPDTSTKDIKKPLQNQKDIYHDINIQLQKINRQLDRMKDKQERLYGKQLLDNLNKQTNILEQQKKKLQQKAKLQQEDLKNQQKTLKNLGVAFDKYGNIANYMSLLTAREDEINGVIADRNKLVESYNASTDKTVKEPLGKQIEAYDKQLKTMEDDFKNIKDKIDKYDKLREEIEDVTDEITKATQAEIEINIKKFRMQLEIRLDMGKAERDWNDFRRNVLEKTNILSGTEFDNIFGDASQNFQDLFSYFNVHGSMGTVEKLTEQLHGTLEQLQQIDKTGTSAIYGDNKAQAMQDLQSDLEELMDQMKDIQGLIDDIDQAYLDTINDIQDQFDKQIKDYEYIQELLETDMDLLTLLYGDKNFEAMQKYYDQMYQNNLKQLDSLRQQREFWKQEWEAAIARGDTNAAKKFEQNYKNAISNINSLIKDSVENLQDSYSNAVEKIFDALDNKLTNGKGTEYLKQSWDLMNKNADEYLDTVNSAFAIQDTQRKYQNALNDTKNIKNQQALKKLMDEQLNILKNKEKLTQYDIDRAQKLLEVEQARIALEDARSAKTSMRLKRDSQGNYSYEYYADEQGIGEAEENYANAQNDLYNFDLDKTKQTTNEILSAWQEFKDKYKDIMLDVSLSDEQRHEKLKLLQDQYGEYFNLKTEQLANARLNLMDSAFKDLASLYSTDIENYNSMADAEKDILMGDIVPTWKNGVAEMAQKMAGEGGLLPVCQDAFDDLSETTKDYQNDLQELATAAGVDFENIRNGIDDTANDLSNLIETNDELMHRMSDELLAIELLKDAAHRLMDEYKNVYDAAKNAVSQIHNYIQAQQSQAAEYARAQQQMADSYTSAQYQMADAYISAYNRIVAALTGGGGGSSGSGGGSGGGGSSDSPSPSGTNNNPNSSYSSKWIGGYGGSDISSFALIPKKKKYSGGGGINTMMYYASGGYTGDWDSDEGRIAVLHEKELVLNKEDTANILNAVNIIRTLNDNVLGKAYNINSGLSLNNNSQDNQQTIEQNVHITASFPNVDSKKQIKEAFSELTNLAAQRIMKR